MLTSLKISYVQKPNLRQINRQRFRSGFIVDLLSLANSSSIFIFALDLQNVYVCLVMSRYYIHACDCGFEAAQKKDILMTVFAFW